MKKLLFDGCGCEGDCNCGGGGCSDGNCGSDKSGDDKSGDDKGSGGGHGQQGGE